MANVLSRGSGLRVELICVGRAPHGKAEHPRGVLVVPAGDLGVRFGARDHRLGRSRRHGRRPSPPRGGGPGRRVERGGLGPTFDDVTRDVWARCCGGRCGFGPISRKPSARDSAVGACHAPANRRQAYLLLQARGRPANDVGTAPGSGWTSLEKPSSSPAPARRLKPMAAGPRALLRRGRGRRSAHRVWRLIGRPEAPWTAAAHADQRRTGVGRDHLGHLAHDGAVDVKITSVGESQDRVGNRFGAVGRGPAGIWRGHLCRRTQTLAESLGEPVGVAETLAVAESCTGGLRKPNN